MEESSKRSLPLLHSAYFQFWADWKQQQLGMLSNTPRWLIPDKLSAKSLNARNGSSAVISLNCWWTFSDSCTATLPPFPLRHKPLLTWIFMNVVRRLHSSIVACLTRGSQSFPPSCLAGSRARHCSQDFGVPSCHRVTSVMEKNRRPKKRLEQQPVKWGVQGIVFSRLQRLNLNQFSELETGCLLRRNTS